MKYFLRTLLTFLALAILGAGQLEQRLASVRLLTPIELTAASSAVHTLVQKRREGLDRAGSALRTTFARLNDLKTDETLQAKPEFQPMIVLGLFEDLEVEVVRTKTVKNLNQLNTWIGYVRSDPYSLVVLTFEPQGLVGYLNIHGRTYSISPLGEGIHLIIENDVQKIGGTEPDSFKPLPLSSQANIEPLTDSFNDGTYVDIMGLYTATALANDPSVVATITNIIAATNESLAKSCVQFRLRLVYTGLSSHDESISGSTLLACMANPTDGCLDDIPTLRATHGADIVSMWQWSPTAVGYIPSIGVSNPAAGFTAIGMDGGLITEAFVHEFGHNMGINHDRYSEDVSLHDYAAPKGAAYDYIDTANGFSTNTCRGSSCYYSGLSCYYSGYYSNPRVLRYGHPMGIPGISDGVSIANQMAVHLANYAQAITDHDPDLSGCEIRAEAAKSSPQCFISTAAYGSFLHPYVEDLRLFRDHRLNSNWIGRSFVKIYYQVSPTIAGLIENHPSLQLGARYILAPIIWWVVEPITASIVFMFAMLIVFYPLLLRKSA